jgi:drug/metabolite transporter (DMT)-like permease
VNDSHASINHNQSKSSQSYSIGKVLSVLFLQQIFSAMAFPVSKYGLDIIEPFTFAFYRFLISAGILTSITLSRNHAVPIDKKDYIKIVGLGVLIIAINQVGYLFGQSLTSAGHGALLFATTPIWIFIAAVVHLKEKLKFRRGLGIIVAVTGVVVIMTGGAVRVGENYLIGDLIILIAVIAWAYYTILGKPLVRKYGAFRVTAYALSSGTIVYLPFGFYCATRVDYSQVTIDGWLSVLYMAIGTSVIAYVLWYWVLKHMEASRMAVFHNLQPIIASAVAGIWLNEPLGWPFLIGGLTVLGGVIVAEI